MGFFSWLYSDTQEPIRVGKSRSTYLLVPPPFQRKYGLYIYEGYYDGYGHIGPYDVYELLAIWNEKFLPQIKEVTEYPQRERYMDFCGVSGEEYYSRAVERFEWSRRLLEDYRRGVEHPDMCQLYGEDYLREVGILIGCGDERHFVLKYPLKFVSEFNPDMRWEDVLASGSDPNQGCD